jgi:parallel beta-helix repeat protein
MAYDQSLFPQFFFILIARFRIFLVPWVLVVSSAILIGGPSEAIAIEYFVAASEGSDGNNGTLQKPFLTLERGVSVLSPGDTLFVRGGTYQRTQYKWEPPSGISGKPVTIMAYQNEKVVVKPVPGYTVFEFRDNSHDIIMDGLTIDARGGNDGIRMGVGGHHMRISNSEIMNAPRNGIQVSDGTYHEFINLRVHDNDGAYDPSKKLQSYGFYVPGNHNLIKGCLIYRNAGYGIHVYHSSGTPSYNTIINNKIYDNDEMGIGIYGGIENTVINNVVWGNTYGIHVDYGASKTKIYHNTVYSNDTNEILLGSTSKDSALANNLLAITSSSPALVISQGSGKSIIENNLIIGNGNDPAQLVKPWEPSVILRDNLIGNNYDPKFQDAENRNFHLTGESDARGAGRVISDVQEDLDGVPRNPSAGFDIGAYQYVGAVSLEPPTFLRILN